MKRSWIKLWLEILDDPKMGRMPDWLWRRAVELFLLAGENGNDGALQPVEDMAWRLRTSCEKLTESLQALSQAGVVHEAQPGSWYVTNFEKRQAAMTDAERAALYRDRHKSVTKPVTERDEHNVTESYSYSASVLEEGGTGGETPAPDVQAVIESGRKTMDGMLHFAAQAKYPHRDKIPEPFLEYADAYNELTGQTPRAATRTDWVETFGEWQAAGLSAQDLRDAYTRLQKMPDFVATSPRSLTKTAIAMHDRRHAAGAKPKSTLDRITQELGGGHA